MKWFVICLDTNKLLYVFEYDNHLNALKAWELTGVKNTKLYCLDNTNFIYYN